MLVFMSKKKWFLSQKHLSKNDPINILKKNWNKKPKKTQPMKSVQRNWLSDEIRSRSDEIREGFLLQNPFEKLVVKN